MENLTEICAFSGQFLVASVSRRRIELPARPILGLLAPTSLWDSRGKHLRPWNRVVRGSLVRLRRKTLPAATACNAEGNLHGSFCRRAEGAHRLDRGEQETGEKGVAGQSRALDSKG